MGKKGIWNASARDGVEYRTAKLWEIILGRASNGINICFYLLIGFASMIATQGYGIAVAVAGALLTGMRVFDGVTDFLFALIFDKMNPSKGKVRICLVLGYSCEALAAILLFNWAAGKFEGLIGLLMFILLYVIFIWGYTMVGISGGLIDVLMTNDPTQRPMVGFIGMLYSYLVPLIFTNLTTFVILPRHNDQYDLAMLGELVYWYVGVCIIFVIATCIAVRRVDVAESFAVISADPSEKEEKVTFKDMFSLLKNNRPMQMYVLTVTSDKLAQQTMSQSMVQVMLNGILIGSYVASTMIGNVSKIIGLIFAFGGSILIAKWGNKKSTTVWSWICIAAAAASICFCTALGGPDGMTKIGVLGVPLVIYAILDIVRSSATMVLTATGNAMGPDVVDYEYERSGKYLPAVVSGAKSLIDKCISSLGSTVAALCITFIGYTSTVPQKGDPATWPLFWMTMFMVYGLPILGWLCNVIAMKFYALDKERMIQVQKTINERKKEKERT